MFLLRCMCAQAKFQCDRYKMISKDLHNNKSETNRKIPKLTIIRRLFALIQTVYALEIFLLSRAQVSRAK